MQGSAHSPDWQSIDTVLLDMDGTLLDLGFDNHFWGDAHPEIFAIKDAHLGIRSRFDAVYTSQEFGVPKESAAFWPRLAARESFDPSRTLFADDSPAVLRAAGAHGIRWLYAVRRPVRRAPMRAPIEFPGIESVHDLITGFAPPGERSQPEGA